MCVCVCGHTATSLQIDRNSLLSRLLSVISSEQEKERRVGTAERWKEKKNKRIAHLTEIFKFSLVHLFLIHSKFSL